MYDSPDRIEQEIIMADTIGSEPLINLGVEPTLADVIAGQSNYLKYSNPVVSRPIPRLKIATNLQAGETWAKQSVTGTVSVDTTDFVVGTQSLKLTTDAAAGACVARSPTITAADFSDKYALVKVKCSDITKCQELWIYGASDSTFATDFYAWKISDDITQIRSNVWQDVSLSFGAAVVTGSPDRTALVRWQLRAKDGRSGTTGSIDIHLNQIAAFAEPASGAVCIVFDDGYNSVFQNAKPILDAAGMQATVGVIGDLVGVSSTYMNWTQLTQLKNINLWELADHTFTHPDPDGLIVLDGPELDAQFQNNRYALTQHGANRGIFNLIYPHGQYNDLVLSIASKYYGFARTIASYPETLPPVRPLEMRNFLVSNVSSTTTMINRAQSCKDNKDLAIFTFHQVVNSNANSSTQFLTSAFQTFITGLAAIDVPVLTLSGALNGVPA